jgi:hypothetical protein
MHHARLAATLLTALACAATSLGGENPLSVHGFGSWSYRDTDGNNYLGGDEDGAIENFTVALVVNYTPIDALSVRVQGYAEEKGDEFDADGDLDFAFIEYKATDALKFRAGLIKQPVGLYNELSRAGITRSSMDLPSSIYGDNGFIDEGYLGAGITGLAAFENDWELTYDVYGGRIESEFSTGFLIPTVMGLGFVPPGMADEARTTMDVEIEELFGARANAVAPSGLEFGASFYTGKLQPFMPGVVETRENVFGLHARFERGPSTASVEYMRLKADDLFTMNSGYVEYSHRLGGGLQGYIGWEIATQEDVPPGSPAVSVYEHEAFKLGLAYWVNPNMVVKLGYERAWGNWNALPETFSEVLANGLNEDTRLFSIGLDVAF